MSSLIVSSLIMAAFTLLPVQSAYVITGQVLDNSGKAACCVRVCAFAADFDPNKPNVAIPCAFSDAQGRFTIAVSQASKYQLFYDHAAQGYWSPYLPFFRQPSAAIPEILVGDDRVRASATVLMAPKNGLLVGQSIDAQTGLPVESMEFIMCHAANPEVCWQTNAKSSDGNFTIPAPHVPFILRIKTKSFDDWLGPNGEEKETPMSVAPESKAELRVFLKRREASREEAVSESEKRVGVHLPAPVQLSPADSSVFERYPRLTKLEWSPIEGAVSYAIEVDYCDGGRRNRQECVNPQPLKLKSNPPMVGIAGTIYEFNFIGMQPGRWRVWAVDREGREGFKSAWRRFIYLR